MKFEEEYRKSVEEQPVDRAMLGRVRQRIEEEQGCENSAPKRRRRVLRWALSAVVGCLVLVFAGVLIADSIRPSIKVDRFTAATSYAETYRVIDSLIPRVTLWDRISGWFDELFSGGVLVDDATAPEAGPDHSTTNTQVSGVDEADLFKNDGKYLYVIRNQVLYIARAEGLDVRQVAAFRPDFSASEMYVSGDRLILIGSERVEGTLYTVAAVYDIADRSAPRELDRTVQEGSYRNSRLKGEVLYLMSGYRVYSPDRNRPDSYVPVVNGTLLPVEEIYYCAHPSSPTYTVLAGYDLSQLEQVSQCAVLGAADNLYLNGEVLLLASNAYSDGEGTFTQLSYFSLNEGKIEAQEVCNVPGRVLNQFSLDEYAGYFRVAVTETTTSGDPNGMMWRSTVNSIYIFNREMEQVGSITGLAPEERIYSARFEGERAYLVTYQETDPLYCIDLSEPESPVLLGELKIPGYSTYLHVYDEDLLFGLGIDESQQVKLSMYDISDPQNMYETKRVLNAYYSEALANHKALIINPSKNLIGLFLEGYFFMDRESAAYAFYSFDQGFREVALFPLGQGVELCRGAYIGDHLYVLSSAKGSADVVVSGTCDDDPDNIRTVTLVSSFAG